MRKPLRAFTATLLTIGMLTSALVAAPTLPVEVRTSPNAAGSRTIIQAFVMGEVNKLMGSDPVAQRSARMVLIEEVQAAGAANTPSASFLDELARILNQELTRTIRNADVRAKINAGIVCSRVAEKAQNNRLADATLLLLADPNEAVALWGIRSAKELMLPAFGVQGRQNNLVPAIVTAAQKNPTGIIFEAAYEALGPNLLQVPAQRRGDVVAVCIPEIHKLMALRVKEWEQGIPSGIFSERMAINALISQPSWEAQTPEMRVRTVQLMSDLIGVVGQRAGQLTDDERRLGALMVRMTGRGLQAIALLLGNQQLETELERVARVNEIARAEAILEVSRTAHPALVKVKEFSQLKPPPVVSSSANPSTTQASNN